MASRFIRRSSLSSINPHQFFAPNKSQKPSFSNLSLFNPPLLPQFALFPTPKASSLLTKQNKKSFSTIMSSASTNPASDLHEIPQILKPRTVVKKVLAKEQAEGDGATVRRSIGRWLIPQCLILCFFFVLIVSLGFLFDLKLDFVWRFSHQAGAPEFWSVPTARLCHLFVSFLPSYSYLALSFFWFLIPEMVFSPKFVNSFSPSWFPWSSS